MIENEFIEIDREEDGRFIAEIPALPVVIVYGSDVAEAIRKARVLALRVRADRVAQRTKDR
jgi:predicted RNase H-like HicB family nuclease